MSNRIKLSPGWRARLATAGINPDDIGKIYNRAGTTTIDPDDANQIPVPANSAELADFFGDPGRYRSILTNTDTLRIFIDRYAAQQQGPDTDLNKLVAEETQRVLAQYLRDNEADLGTIKRLNLDPQTRPPSMLTSHRQGAAYNSKAAGVIADGYFESAADFLWNAWCLNPDPQARAKMESLRNAYSSVIPAEGGFLVPETLRSQLLQIALEMSVVRPRATVIPMESARVPIPYIDSTSNASSVFGGMIGYWGEESAALTASNPTFGRVVLDAKKLTGYAQIPNELLSDSLISFAALVERLWPQALAFFEDVAFMTGSGVGEPLGFIGASNDASIAVSAEAGQAASTVILENVINMYSRMLPTSLNQAVWICAPNVIPQLFTMALSVGTGGSPVMISNVAGPAPMTIFGRPLIVSEKASSLGSRGDISFVDLGYYLVGDRQVMTAASSMDYRFANDQTAYRILQRVDGRPWLQSAITPQNSGDTLSPFVEIAART